MSDKVHIFWDNTNIFLTAVDTAGEMEPGLSRYAVRVHFNNLFQLVSRGREVLTKELAGSVPPQAASLWEYAERMGFKTTLLQRVENGFGILREQTVDEMLHLRIANTILARPNPETLVLLSGDGRVSKTGTSFPGQLRFALQRDWKVEVYSWRGGYNSRAFGELKSDFPKLVKVEMLDDYYYSLTFIKAGRYWSITQLGEQVELNIPDRAAKPLNIIGN
ncbi:MAG: NYN domain-containing protein [Calditrichaeota bacterium]|nr:NYN domain-containing protein [Calditrichota bacterium]